MSTDTSNSGIYVVEGPAKGQPIPVDGDSVTAFIGPAPRGPVDHAVTIRDIDDFAKVFGVPQYHCRMEYAVRQFFANGGENAVVVRVSGTTARNRIYLPTASGDVVLEARNPGPLEYIRASVDYDRIDAEDELSFNLVVQRLRAAGSAWIDAQEVYRGTSLDPASRDYLGYLLGQSDLVTLVGQPPTDRPKPTYKSLTVRQAGYIESRTRTVSSPPPGDYDLIGSTAQGTGFGALEHLPDIGQIVLLSGAEGVPIGPVAMLAADRFCRAHQAILIVDPPARWRSVDDVVSDQERSGYASPNTVTWFPGIQVRNKQGDKMISSAAGGVAACLADCMHSDGVHLLHEEGSVMLRSGALLSTRVNAEETARLSRVGVNSLAQRSALHLQLQGEVTQARYGSLATDWNALDLRRDTLFILRRIRSGTRWTFFQESGPDMWTELTAMVSDFMQLLRERSMLIGETSEQAFFVKCDADTNAGLEGEIGAVSFIVGFALRRPGELMAFRFQRRQGRCKVAELGWCSRLERTA